MIIRKFGDSAGVAVWAREPVCNKAKVSLYAQTAPIVVRLFSLLGPNIAVGLNLTAVIVDEMLEAESAEWESILGGSFLQGPALARPSQPATGVLRPAALASSKIPRRRTPFNFQTSSKKLAR